MSEGRGDLLEETTLRRALRLEADEHPPRFDPAAIATAARAVRPSSATILTGLAVAGVTGVVAGTVWSFILGAAPQLADAIGGAALEALISLATLLVPIAEIATEPAVPLSLLAALGVAILFELRERREHAHVHSS
jgi:hypothetical protein